MEQPHKNDQCDATLANDRVQALVRCHVLSVGRSGSDNVPNYVDRFDCRIARTGGTSSSFCWSNRTRMINVMQLSRTIGSRPWDRGHVLSVGRSGPDYVPNYVDRFDCRIAPQEWDEQVNLPHHCREWMPA
jgi:hypothetical protein